MSPADPTPHEPDAPAAAPKKGLMGWLAGAVSQLESQASKAAPVEAPKEAAPVRTPSGPLGGPMRSASLKLPGSGPLPGARKTGELVPPKPTPVTTPSGPLPLGTPLPGEPAEETPKGPEDPQTASRRRMAFIVAYMKDPTSDPEFADKPLVYRIFTEEREYQQQLVNTLKPQLERLPANAEQRAELEHRLKTAQNRQSQLFLQLKKLTGVKGKTGGTGFLSASNVLPEPKGLGGEGQ